MSDGSRTGAPARRAIVRWAARLFRREWRQQLLVLTLLAITVAAAVAGVTIAVNVTSGASGEFGSANAIVTIANGDPAQAQSQISAVQRRYGTVDIVAHHAIVIPGTTERLDLRDTDPAGTYTRPMVVLRNGRYPTATGEIAITRHAADVMAVSTGGTVTLDGRDERVVGIVENSGRLTDDFALFAHGQLPDVAAYTVLFRLTDTSTVAVPNGAGDGSVHSTVEVRGVNQQAVIVTVVAAATIALLLVALVAAVGFVVIAQRRQRQLGLLAAIGATDRHVRMVMIANGTIVGIVGALSGVVLGAVGWVIASGAVESAADHRIGTFDLPWSLIAVVGVLAVVMATLSAWWPARTAARVPVMVALSGRPPKPLAVHRSLIAAALMVGGGVAAIYWSGPTKPHVNALALVAGLIAVVVGAVFVSPAVVRLLGVVARRLPFAPRLALRDLARYQARAGAALAATSLALGIAVATIGIANASLDRSHPANLSTSEMLIQIGNDPVAGTAADVSQRDSHAAGVAAALGADVHAVPLLIPLDTTANPGRSMPVSVLTSPNPHELDMLGIAYVATPELLAVYGIDPSVASGVDVLTARSEPILVGADSQVEPGDTPPPSKVVALPIYGDAPNTLVTEAAVARNGWSLGHGAWIVESRKPLTAAQIAAARVAAANAGLQIITHEDPDRVAPVRNGATIVGGVLALLIVAMAVGLIRGEAAADLRTLTATGAAAGTRRAIAASTAAAVAFCGALVGVTGASIALVAAFHSQLQRMVPLPLVNLAVVVVGIPVIAAVAGWLLAGREPKAFSRQPLD